MGSSRFDSVSRTDLLRLAVYALAGVAAVVGSYAAAGFRPGFVVAPVSKTLTVLAPGAAVAFAIQVLGGVGQSLVLVGAVVLTVLVFALLAAIADLAVSRLTGAPGSGLPIRPARGLATLLLGGGVAFVLTSALVPSLVAGVCAAVVVVLGPLDEAATTPTSLARRSVLRAGAGAASVAALAAVGRSVNRPTETSASRDTAADTGDAAVDASTATPESADDSAGDEPTAPDDESTATPAPAALDRLLTAASERSLDVSGIDPLLTDIGNYYTVDINSVDPDVSPEDWSLTLTGAVPEERTYSYDDLRSLPAEHRFVTLRCVGEKLNGKKIDTGLWTGVPITEVLPDLPRECCVMVRATDGYFEEFPLSALENGFLAYGMNGEPLPRKHGRPVRLLVPGHWGEINVKWISEIEVLTRERDGYWEQRGWHGTGPVNTVAKLHAVNRLGDGRIQVGGHAYAGTRDVERVEVSTDGGETWNDATLSERLPGATSADATSLPDTTAEDAWRMWSYEYEATGRHEVVVRATDGTGALQSDEKERAFPSGPSGWVSRTVRP